MSCISTITIFISFMFYKLNEVHAENVFTTAFTNLHKDPGPQETTRAHIETNWIEQKLDHFDEKENRTWQMVRVKKKLINNPFIAFRGHQ